MNYTLLLSSIMLCAVMSASAQITITRDDLSNLAGVTVVQVRDTTNLSGISPGYAGAGQVWNLSAIGKDANDTIFVVSPAGLGCSSAFPGATYALRVPGFNGYQYVSVSNTSLEIMGLCGVISPPSISIVPYTPGYKKLNFPATYNTTFSGTTRSVVEFAVAAPPPDSGRLISTISYTTQIDGWGMVTTPAGTYNALRVKHMETKIDSIYIYMGGVWSYAGLPPTTNVSTTYEWWIKNSLPIASLQVNDAGILVSAAYLAVAASGVDEPVTGIEATTVYPNPASASFRIENSHPAAATFLLVNLLGQTVIEAPIAGPVMEFSTETMTKGIYMTIIRDAKGETLSTGKLVVE